MPSDFFNFRDIEINQSGDIIEVILRDNNYNPYFKGKANLTNKREMSDLLFQLRSKGVDLLSLL